MSREPAVGQFMHPRVRQVAERFFERVKAADPAEKINSAVLSTRKELKHNARIALAIVCWFAFCNVSARGTCAPLTSYARDNASLPSFSRLLRCEGSAKFLWTFSPGRAWMHDLCMLDARSVHFVEDRTERGVAITCSNLHS
eukprot:3879027-Pleurochrysis_carterae.AAC.2